MYVFHINYALHRNRHYVLHIKLIYVSLIYKSLCPSNTMYVLHRNLSPSQEYLCPSYINLCILHINKYMSFTNNLHTHDINLYILHTNLCPSTQNLHTYDTNLYVLHTDVFAYHIQRFHTQWQGRCLCTRRERRPEEETDVESSAPPHGSRSRLIPEEWRHSPALPTSPPGPVSSLRSGAVLQPSPPPLQVPSHP